MKGKYLDPLIFEPAKEGDLLVLALELFLYQSCRACFWGSGNILKNIIKKYSHWNFNIGTKHGGNTCLHFLAAGKFKYQSNVSFQIFF